tara:strand:+ start:10824 stop:11633 length:810 start_codon:yes stop_codon:yes gene_type:complete
MSFLDSLVSKVSGFLFGGSSNSASNTLLNSVVTGAGAALLLNSINKSNDAVASSPSSNTSTTAVYTAPVDRGVRLQLSADSNAKIPVLYGTAVFGGNLIDVKMTADNKIMYFVYVLSEVTGNLMSTGAASAYTFNNIYWNDQEILFKEGGQIIDHVIDREGNINKSLDGLVEIYCYKNGSTVGALPEGYAGSVPHAYNIVPDWTDAWMMSELLFAVVKVTYSQEKGVTGIGDLAFKISNSMTLPGDVLFDQMTNTRYGAGILSADIKDI